MRKNLYILSILLAALTSCRKGDTFEQAPYSLETSTRMAAELVKGAPECFGHIKHDKVTTLSQGVSLLDLAYLDKGGYAVQLYMFKVVLGTASVGVAVPAPDKKTDYVGNLAEGLNQEVLVLGAVNGDSQGSDKEPSGILYRNGAAIKGAFSDAKGGFFATLKDGTAVVASQADYGMYRTSLYNAVGTRERILQGGYPVALDKDARAARSFVAVSADGMTVWLGVVDGVYFYYSNGVTASTLADILKAAGASDAALLPGGDVTTLVRRDDLGEKRFPLVNSPAANGIEKESVNALAVIEN